MFGALATRLSKRDNYDISCTLISAGLFLLLSLITPSSASADALQDYLTALPQTSGALSYYRPTDSETELAIARRYSVSLYSLQSVNPYSRRIKELLLPGLFFPVETEAEGIAINLAERAAYLFDETGRLSAVYPIAIGRVDWETPTGSYSIVNKAKDPIWYPPSWAEEEEPVPPGPDNPLGDRWIGLSEPGLGLHSTNNPSSIGRAVSHGCIRLYPEGARELYSKVAIGMPVKIVYETLLLGYSPESRTIYLTVYPDIYKKETNNLPRARTLIADAGLAMTVDESHLSRMLESADGLPFPLLGSEMRLTINDQELSLPLGPTPRAGDYLVPAHRLANALEAEVVSLPEMGWFMLRRGKDSLSFGVGELKAWSNHRAVRLIAAPILIGKTKDTDSRGILLIPLNAVCNTLHMKIQINRQVNTIALKDTNLLAQEWIGVARFQPRGSPNGTNAGVGSTDFALPQSILTLPY